MQPRAARTRQALVSAAADEFDRNGYSGASMPRVCRAAGVSVGALTFHFSGKEELAVAVREQGGAATMTAVAAVTARCEEAVQTVVSLTLALTGLLENDVAVRAAARLARELPGAPDWFSAWVPAIHQQLRNARGGQPASVADRAAVAALATHLVTGAEIAIRQRARRHSITAGQSVAELTRIWEMVRGGFAASAPCQGGRAVWGSPGHPM
ncbi:TetR/AcrR family transcriptional regulator [Streptomyces sp. MZ04]|uniref:TetR/AcrR family transcriptional regulator n=1 Tax=Streptomyces sp. MZ04 TaxID=2559236 RepID=UPI00107EE27E|nr:TetR/AcrR family transcriptional regulator [Streptomyces sp. MZ04]TGB13258.1 TetR/AcrR family transcriptional regulator [Streptomyces sp. MZ04]